MSYFQVLHAAPAPRPDLHTLARDHRIPAVEIFDLRSYAARLLAPLSRDRRQAKLLRMVARDDERILLGEKEYGPEIAEAVIGVLVDPEAGKAHAKAFEAIGVRLGLMARCITSHPAVMSHEDWERLLAAAGDALLVRAQRIRAGKPKPGRKLAPRADELGTYFLSLWD